MAGIVANAALSYGTMKLFFDPQGVNTATAAAIYGAAQPVLQGLAVGTATVASAGLAAWYFQDLLPHGGKTLESDANDLTLLGFIVGGAGVVGGVASVIPAWVLSIFGSRKIANYWLARQGQPLEQFPLPLSFALSLTVVLEVGILNHLIHGEAS